MRSLRAIQIDQGVTTVATKKGLRPTAIPDITARARNVFQAGEGRSDGVREPTARRCAWARMASRR